MKVRFTLPSKSKLYLKWWTYFFFTEPQKNVAEAFETVLSFLSNPVF